MKNVITHKAPKGCIITHSKLSEDGKYIEYICEEVKKLPTELSELNSGGWRETSSLCTDGFVRSRVVKQVETDFKGDNEYDSKEMAEAFIALRQLVRFRDAWNKTSDFSYPRHYIRCNLIYGIVKTTGYTNDIDSCISVLHFHSSELRDKFLEQFKDLITQALPLI